MSRTDYQDSTDESVTSSGSSSPVFVAKQIVSDRGAMFLGVLFAVALASWAVARVNAEHDRIEMIGVITLNRANEQQRLTQMEIDHYKEAFQRLERQSRMTELKLDDWGVTARRAGLVLPGDYTRGPQGNIDAESYHIDVLKRPNRSVR